MRQPHCAQVLIHPSQSPEAVRGALWESLRTRRVNHKFHYDSYKQTEKWLALHQAFSPSRTDPDCEAIYDRSFDQVIGNLAAVIVVGTSAATIVRRQDHPTRDCRHRTRDDRGTRCGTTNGKRTEREQRTQPSVHGRNDEQPPRHIGKCANVLIPSTFDAASAVMARQTLAEVRPLLTVLRGCGQGLWINCHRAN